MKRMYILVLDDIPLGYAVNSACHAAVAAALKWQDTAEVQEWLNTSFRKVTCRVNRKEFENAMVKEGDWVKIEELNLGGRDMALAFKPREEYHKMFKYLKLLKD